MQIIIQYKIILLSQIGQHPKKKKKNKKNLLKMLKEIIHNYCVQKNKNMRHFFFLTNV